MDTITKAVLLAVAQKAGGALGGVGKDLKAGLGQLQSLASGGVQVAGDLGKQIGSFGQDAGQRVGSGIGKLPQGHRQPVRRRRQRPTKQEQITPKIKIPAPTRRSHRPPRARVRPSRHRPMG